MGRYFFRQQSDNNRTIFSDTEIVAELSTTEPLTLEEAKNYLRINHTQDDSYITELLRESRLQAEKFLNSDILPKRRIVYYTYLTEPVNLYYAPITEVESVTVDGIALADGTVAGIEAEYEVLGLDNPKIDLLNGEAEKVAITYTTAGRTDGIKSGLRALVAWKYYNRSAKMDTNWKQYLSPFRTKGYYGIR